MRRKPDIIVDIQQPFDPNKFNFTKIQDKEILTKLQFLAETPKVSHEFTLSSHQLIVCMLCLQVREVKDFVFHYSVCRPTSNNVTTKLFSSL